MSKFVGFRSDLGGFVVVNADCVIAIYEETSHNGTTTCLELVSGNKYRVLDDFVHVCSKIGFGMEFPKPVDETNGSDSEEKPISSLDISFIMSKEEVVI